MKNNIKLLFLACCIQLNINGSAQSKWTEEIYDNLGSLFENFYDNFTYICDDSLGVYVKAPYEEMIDVKDCITNEWWETNHSYNFHEDFGVYFLNWGNTSHGVEFILIINNRNTEVFLYSDETIPVIMRELNSIKENEPNKISNNDIINISNSLLYPHGIDNYRKILRKKGNVGVLDLYFDVELFKRMRLKE